MRACVLASRLAPASRGFVLLEGLGGGRLNIITTRVGCKGLFSDGGEAIKLHIIEYRRLSNDTLCRYLKSMQFNRECK